MILIYLLLKKILISLIFIKDKNFKNKVQELKQYPFFKIAKINNYFKFNKNGSILNLEKIYNKWSFISLIINFFYFTIFDVFLFSIIFIQALSLLLNLNLNFSYLNYLIPTLLWLWFIIRINSDLIKFNLSGISIANWKKKLFILDLITLNIFGMVAFFKYKDYMLDLNRTTKFASINENDIKIYKNINKRLWIINLVILSLPLLTCLLLLSFSKNNALILNWSLITLFLFIIIFMIFFAISLPSMIIHNFIIKNIKLNNKVSLDACRFIVKYISLTIDQNLMFAFIIKLNLQNFLIQNSNII